MNKVRYNINDYAEQLKDLCQSCSNKRCDGNKICVYKKFAFNLAKRKLKKQERVNL